MGTGLFFSSHAHAHSRSHPRTDHPADRIRRTSFIAIDQKSDLVEQRDEDVDGELGFFLGVVYNHVLFGFFLKLSEAAPGELRARTLLVRERTLPWPSSA